MPQDVQTRAVRAAAGPDQRVADPGGNFSGSANNDVTGASGANLDLVSFVSTASTATSIVSIDDKLAILFEADAAMARVSGVTVREGTIDGGRERKTFASTEGARIVDHFLQNGPEAVAETKAWSLRSAWSDLDDPAFTALMRDESARLVYPQLVFGGVEDD